MSRHIFYGSGLKKLPYVPARGKIYPIVLIHLCTLILLDALTTRQFYFQVVRKLFYVELSGPWSAKPRPAKLKLADVEIGETRHLVIEDYVFNVTRVE
jgi:hypothetical protein